MTNQDDQQNQPAGEAPLQSWKEIADYLERDIRTAQRWEESGGLPVRRHGGSAGSVYAYPSEIEVWRVSRQPKSGGEAPSTSVGEQPRRILIPALAAAGVIAVVLLVIGFGPVLNPPSPIAQAAEDGLRTELVWPEARGASPQGSVSPDGKFVTFVDWGDEGNLAIRNLETGENRRLTDTANGVNASYDGMSFANESRISPDGERVVYSWYQQSPVGNSTELRLLPLGGAAEQPRTIWSPGDGSYASVQGWFPSGDRVAAVVSTSDNTSRIVTVSLDDGDVRQIRSIAWSARPQVRVSPDGRHIAYSRSASREQPAKDIFMVAVDGSSESAIVKHAARDEIVEWSPDGGHLLFNSDRSGQASLWAQRVDHGTAVGEAFLVMSKLGVGSGMGMTRDGSLFYPVRVSRRRLKIAKIDMETGKFIQQPSSPIERFVGGNSGGVFSPDGDELAYRSQRRGWNQNAIVIRSLKTGKERELPHQLRQVRGIINWRPDGKRLRVRGGDQNGEQGFFDVDAATGETQLIVASAKIAAPQWTPDGKRILGRSNQGEGLHSYSLADGSIEAIPGDLGDAYLFSLSPDGHQIATIHGRSEIRLRPVEGGDGRVLATTDEQHRFGRWTVWTPDGKALLVLKGVRWTGRPTGKALWTLWIVPVDGSAPVETELNHELANGGALPLDIHPDGKRVVYAAGGYFQQFWALRDLTFDELEKAAE